MRKEGWLLLSLSLLGAVPAAADCAGAIQEMEASGRLPIDAQRYLDKATSDLGKRHGERDCLAWVEAAEQAKENTERRYSRYEDRDAARPGSGSSLDPRPLGDDLGR